MTTPISRAAVLAILRTPAASDTFPDMIRRVDALEGCGVRVKALEWKQAGGNIKAGHGFSAWGHLSHTPATIYLTHGGWWLSVDCKTYPTLEAAKAAAQADYEARILAALEPVAQPETPTPGQFATMCLAIEDVVMGRGFDVDPWRSIQDDPPPKDGTKFLAYAKHAQVMNGEFQLVECQFSRGWWGLSPVHNWPASFTHWQPLTKPGETTSAIHEAVKAYLRNALMVGGWKGEQE